MKEYNYNNNTLNVVLDDTKSAWFEMNNVCRILALNNVTKVLKNYEIVSSESNTYINESGLHRLIDMSRNPIRFDFQKFVLHCLLPDLRNDSNDKDLLDAVKIITDHNGIDISMILDIAQTIVEKNTPLITKKVAENVVEKRWITDDELPEKVRTVYCKPNTIARMYLGKKITSVAVNRRLIEVGLAKRDNKSIIPTAEGEKYSVVSMSGTSLTVTTTWLPSVRHLLGDF